MAGMLPLGVIWEFIGPILGDSIKERIKPKGSSEIAKEKVLNLSRALENVSKCTDDFVDALKSLVNATENKLPRDIITSEVQKIETISENLLTSLEKLSEALDEINPQLEIYENELVQNINHYRCSRMRLLESLYDLVGLNMIEVVGPSWDNNIKIKDIDLRPILLEAEKNRDLILKATTEFRDFIKEEFKFKELF